MNSETKPLFPVLPPVMSASFHPPVVTVQPRGMAISLLFGDLSIDLNNNNELRSAYKNTTYSFTIDNPSDEVFIIIKYALDKTSETAKAFLTFLSNIECFTRELIAIKEENEEGVCLMYIQDEIKILIPQSQGKKEYSFALSVFATREDEGQLKVSIDSIDIAKLS
ncbi:hypothetical protein [Thiothrix subterranea]|uniref:Uncharacterized protein n=1 Tax=Thiothrix subterranea TaxID=2735563 RepID=A0AA51MPW7_9GAMM|nr:hypothetical protein [Thiothrix subterranea]MDQ5770723.1 hypothetical protein [Thiothrix subterranea]WML87719.1 hypothetical protein RCG00_04975 [Thiothrix subterranea]